MAAFVGSVWDWIPGKPDLPVAPDHPGPDHLEPDHWGPIPGSLIHRLCMHLTQSQVKVV